MPSKKDEMGPLPPEWEPDSSPSAPTDPLPPSVALQAAAEDAPYTSAELADTPRIQPALDRMFVVHKTAADLIGKYKHSPICLADSMADYLNEQWRSGLLCVGTLGDTTNHYFIFAKS